MGVFDLFRVLIYRKAIIVCATLAGLAAAVAVGMALPEKYASTAIVQVDSIQRNSLTGLYEPRLRVAEFLGQQAAVAGSRTVALQVVDFLVDGGFIALADYEPQWRDETGGELVPGNDLRLWAADQLMRNVEIEADALESTLAITYRAGDAGEAARIANAIAYAYMETVLDQKRRRFTRNAEGYSDETRSLADDVSVARRDLAKFRADSGILPIGAQGVEGAEVELAAITARLAEARADNSEARSLLAQAVRTSRDDLLHFPIPDDALAARQAQMRLGAVIAQLARIAERYGPAYPDYIEAENEKTALENTILASIRDRAEYAGGRLAALEAEANALKAIVSDVQTTRDAYNLLEDRVEASQETFNLVATRSLQEALQARVNSAETLLLARAVPSSSTATPPLWLLAALGLVLGGMLGASAAVAAELHESRVRSADAVRVMFRAPLLGEVSYDASVARKPIRAAA